MNKERKMIYDMGFGLGLIGGTLTTLIFPNLFFIGIGIGLYLVLPIVYKRFKND